MNSITLRVFFDGQFYVLVFERYEDDKLSVSKCVYGKEPSDNEVFDFINNNFYNLVFSSSIETNIKEKKKNPKRRLKEAKNALKSSIGTKSQKALKLLQENLKKEKIIHSKEEDKLSKERKFELKVIRRKEKHRGH